jgi:adenosylhomocysteine nucleosidase
MICYAFPLAHEASLLLKHCTEKESFSIDGLHCTLANFGRRRVLVALVGMGEASAGKNTEALFQYFRLKAVVLAGYGGALVPPLKVGQVVISANFTSEAVLGFLRMLSGFDFASFRTTDEVVGTPEKRDAYARATNSQVADMETEAVAGIVRGREVPFMAVRAISDDYRQVLPTGALAAGFDAPKGRATPLRLFGYLAMRPGEIAPLRKFIAGLSVARKNLTKFLEQLNNELPPSW